MCRKSLFSSSAAKIPLSDDTLVRLNGARLIKEMKAVVVPEL
jgi:hypothetical protein